MTPFDDTLFRFPSCLSGRYEIGHQPLTADRPVLQIFCVGEQYRGEGVSIAIFGAVDRLHPDIRGNDVALTAACYDLLDDLATTNSYRTFLAGVAAGDDDGTGIVGVAPDAALATTATGPGSAGADIFLTFGYGAPHERGNLSTEFDATSRGGLGTIALTMGQGDIVVKDADKPFAFVNSEYGVNSHRQVITTAGLTGYAGLALLNSDSTGGARMLVKAPILTSSYVSPGRPIPDDVDFCHATGGPFSVAAPRGVATTLCPDISGAGGLNDDDSFLRDSFERLAEAIVFGGRQLPAADDVVDSSTNAAIGVTGNVAALMLEANPELGWRDVQGILAMSTRPKAVIDPPGGTSEFRFPFAENGRDAMSGGAHAPVSASQVTLAIANFGSQ